MATQAERRAASQASVLDAALSCLLGRGYGGFTTTEVEKRSRYSRGILFMHFPTKASLLAATIERLFAEMLADYGRTFGRLEPDERTIPRAFEMLEGAFADPRLHVVFELYTASRTDAELRASLAPLVEATARQIESLGREVMAQLVDLGPGEWEFGLEVVRYILQGLALEGMVRDVSGTRQRLRTVVPVLAEMVRARRAAAGAVAAVQANGAATAVTGRGATDNRRRANGVRRDETMQASERGQR